MSKNEQLKIMFLAAIEKKDGQREFSEDEMKDVAEVTDLIASVMDDMGLDFTSSTALITVHQN